MRNFVVLALLGLFLFTVHANFLDSELESDSQLKYVKPGNFLENPLPIEEKPTCIKRHLNCDHQPNGCCRNSACRCNLWGENCQCIRQGLFSK